MQRKALVDLSENCVGGIKNSWKIAFQTITADTSRSFAVYILLAVAT